MIRNRKASIKIYIIPFIIITSIFAIITYTMSYTIKNYFYDLKKEEAMKIARSIYNDMSHTSEAVNIISDLLDNKLKNSLLVAKMNREDYNNEFFVELANTFEIDEIYSYNSDGIIEYSSSGKYIGWVAYEGHPVFDFMKGKEDMLIENIRKDSESDMYYKYGYIKHSDGYFIQIGILAEKAHNILDSIRIQNNLEDMVIGNDIIEISALNSDYVIVASSDVDAIGTHLKDEAAITDISKTNIHDRLINIDSVEQYEIFLPLSYGSENIVAFRILYSLDEMFPAIRTNTQIAIGGLCIVYISLIFSIYSSYKRNKKLIELAYYDSLTGLPNLEFLKQKLNTDLVTNKNKKAILMIKCDNISFMNLSFGYDYGDRVLKELGNRIESLESRNIELFKFTGDKFVLYIKQYKNRDDILEVVMKVKELLTQPIIINKTREHITFKIGIMEYKESHKSADELLKDATIALKYTEASETNNYTFFDEDMESDIQRQEILERELRVVTMEEDASKIYLVYQPIIDSKTNSIRSFEALARMNSKEFGSVSPIEFIQIAESKQLIVPLSNFILRMACSFISSLLKMGLNEIRVAVNISTIHLLQEDFVSTVLGIVEETGINGRNLELELTETIMMDNFEIIKERLKELRTYGIQISLDDFGTGYSSIDRLIELKVDTLKIDQYFIKNINEGNKDSQITEDIISIAHRLGLKTVAEGVELEVQKNYLLEYKCDSLQGYLFSKPVSEVEVIKLLNQYNIKQQ